MNRRAKYRILALAVAAVSSVVLAPIALRTWRDLYVKFPVKTLTLANNAPQFHAGGLIPEERLSVASEVRAKSWARIARVIVDVRPEQGSVAYAFVGGSRGTVHILKPSGLDSWEIVGDAGWTGDPRDFALRR